MQTPISGCIRQLRRQQGMTQTELGGEHFSKSYVSAVEREKIIPSYEALRFFAEQLDQSFDYFKQLVEQPGLSSPGIPHMVSSLSLLDENDEQDDSSALLDMVLEGTELPHASFTQEIATLPLETLMCLPLQKQAHYCLVKGLILQEQGDFEAALPLLERSLVLSPPRRQSVILDALGTNFALTHIYQTALSYHQRALLLLKLDKTKNANAFPLLLKVELHCGDDYRALGIHTQALKHYEYARQSLDATSNMEIAGQVYMGLGYCAYASIYQNPSATKFSYEEKERVLQRAASFLLQSRTLYQVSSNQIGESKARLLHAIILLALCSLRYQMALQRARAELPIQSLQCATLLNEAEEQCRQVLLSWGEGAYTGDLSSAVLEGVVYSALSSLVSVSVQRAAVARLEGYHDTALRSRAYAAYLCQRILDTLTNSDLLRSLIADVLTLEDAEMYRIQALPRLPDTTKDNLTHNPMSLVAIFSASGEVAEELGRVATNTSYASDCYARANSCFKASLQEENQSTFSKEHDVSSLMRNYQHCITLIEERIHAAPEVAEETYQTLLALCKDRMYQP